MKYVLKLLLVIDYLFTETETCFLIPEFNNSRICRIGYYIKCSKETFLKVSVYRNSLLLENLFPDHGFFKKCGQVISFCRYSSSQCLLKTCWRGVILEWHVLKMSWSLLADVLKKSWRRFEGVLRTSWRWTCKWFQDVLKMFWRQPFKTSRRPHENVFERFLRRFGDALLRQICFSWSIRLENILKMSIEEENKWHLQDIFKTSSPGQIFARKIIRCLS